jgi:hypothetical protein
MYEQNPLHVQDKLLLISGDKINKGKINIHS